MKKLNLNTTQANPTKQDEQLVAGPYVARLAKIATIGVHKQKAWAGKEKPDADDIVLSWQLTNNLRSDGTPYYVNSREKVSTFETAGFEKIIRLLTEANGGTRPDDIEDFIGTPVIVNLQSKTDKEGNADGVWTTVFAKDISLAFRIDPISRQRQDYQVPELVEEAVVFDFYEPDYLAFDGLKIEGMNWIQESIQKAVNYEAECKPLMTKSYMAYKSAGKLPAAAPVTQQPQQPAVLETPAPTLTIAQPKQIQEPVVETQVIQPAVQVAPVLAPAPTLEVHKEVDPALKASQQNFNKLMKEVEQEQAAQGFDNFDDDIPF